MYGSKTCFKCKKVLPLSEFYAHPAMGDGHLGKCKTCAKKDTSKNRKKNIDYYRSYDKERSNRPERVKLALEYTRRYRKKDSRRMKCYDAVARAIRKGTIEKHPCVICGANKSLAHHESYDRPLEVVWYCQIHHKERHKQMAIEGINLC